MIEEITPFVTENDLTVLELALRLRWRSVLERATLCPHELSEQDEDGLNLLHWACCNPPPLWVFEALLLGNDNNNNNNPFLKPLRQAACTKDFNTMTPLHCACACQAPIPIIALLIEACPECVEICDQDGWTPLHFLTVSVRKEEGVLRYIHKLARALLADHPKMASAQDSSGRTVLEMLCVMYQVELHRYYYFRPKTKKKNSNDNDQETNTSLNLFWDVVQLLVDAHLPPTTPLPTPDHNNDDTMDLRSSSLLHRLVAFPRCPVELLMCTCRRNPELLLHQDREGNTPLHLAVSLKAVRLERFLLCFEMEEQPSPLVATQVRNNRNETPLDVAIRAHPRWSSSHRLLLEANPAALEALDIDDILYAMVLARFDSSPIFQILRGRPSLVQGATTKEMENPWLVKRCRTTRLTPRSNQKGVDH